jgi:hypothetical protein
LPGFKIIYPIIPEINNARKILNAKSPPVETNWVVFMVAEDIAMEPVLFPSGLSVILISEIRRILLLKHPVALTLWFK